MEAFLTKLLNLVYENSCLICNAYSNKDVVCKTCEREFIERKLNYKKSFKELSVFSWGLYEGKLRQAIISLKNGKKELAKYFSYKLFCFLSNNLDLLNNKDFLLIPVPSHLKRVKERGYCQTTLLANELSNRLNFCFSNNFVTRIKETQHMNNIANINERIKNVKNAFRVISSTPKEKNILIVDDILTSGSTICELARTIHEKYPELNLFGLTIASGDTYM